MRQEPKNRIVLAVCYLLLAAGLLRIGLHLRAFGSFATVEGNTVFSYYYDRTSRLYRDGSFPAADRWGFAPGLHAENAPPLLAYATVAAYKASGILRRQSFEAFVAAFPMLIYSLWFVSLLAVFADLSRPGIGLALAAVFSLLPVSIELTHRGAYFEEGLGNWVLFVSVYFIVKVSQRHERSDWPWAAAAVLAITALDLCWQQFPVIYGTSFLLLLSVSAQAGARRLAGMLAAVLGLPLFLGHVIARGAVGNDYSPLSMLRETAIGLSGFGDPELITAMSRGDWAHLTPKHLHDYFGWLGLVLIAAGLARSLLNLQDLKHRAYCLFGLVGLFLLTQFVKERFLAMTLCLPLMASGLELLFDPEPVIRAAGSLYGKVRSAVSRFSRGPRRLAPAAVAGVLVSSAALGIALAWRIAPQPEPEIRLSGLETRLRPGEEREIEVVLRNAGGYPPLNRHAFAGTHIEVENAVVRKIVAESEGRRDKVVFKHFAHVGNRIFFETKHGYLRPGEIARVSFMVAPHDDQPVRIHYRGWIPGGCSSRQEREVVRDLLPGWKDPRKAGWRNEDCVRRTPPNEDAGSPVCRVPVFAAHRKLQDFRCFVSPPQF